MERKKTLLWSPRLFLLGEREGSSRDAPSDAPLRKIAQLGIGIFVSNVKIYLHKICINDLLIKSQVLGIFYSAYKIAEKIILSLMAAFIKAAYLKSRIQEILQSKIYTTDSSKGKFLPSIFHLLPLLVFS